MKFDMYFWYRDEYMSSYSLCVLIFFFFSSKFLMFAWGKFIIQYHLWKNYIKNQQQSKGRKIEGIILESL